MSVSYDTVVIGAGHNGLVTAAYLARAGHKVLVLEQRDVVLEQMFASSTITLYTPPP